MNSKTIEHLQYFIGKVCSVFTPQVNRSFDELHAREHFVVRVQEITVDGIWGVHPHSGMMTFFSMSHVLLITEEVELDPRNPEHAQMIKEYEEKTGGKAESDIASFQKKKPPVLQKEEQVAFVDINYLEKLASQTKNQYNQMDKFKK